jgi:hypothetical protein
MNAPEFLPEQFLVQKVSWFKKGRNPMGAILHIAGVEATPIRHDYVALKITLVNVGSEDVGPGHVLARQTSTDGSIQSVEFCSTLPLLPGEQTKVSQLLRGTIREINFKSYCPTDDTRPTIPLSGMLRRGLTTWPFDKAS